VNITARSDNVALTSSSAIVQIRDNEPPVIVTVSDPTVVEGDSGSVDAVFVVSLSARYSQELFVYYNTIDRSASERSDYEGRYGYFYFTPGETRREIRVPVRGDTVSEGD